MTVKDITNRDELDQWVKEEIERIEGTRKKREKKDEMIQEVFKKADEISSQLEPLPDPDSAPEEKANNFDGAMPKEKREKPEPPAWFPKARFFEPRFNFVKKKDLSFQLLGKDYYPRKLSPIDGARLAKKIPSWFNYLGWEHFDLGEDGSIGVIDVAVIIGTIISNAFEDYDLENDIPGPLMLSVCEEVVKLIGDKELELEDMVNGDLEEIQAAVIKIWEANQGFFSTIWQNSGLIRKTITTLYGVVTRGLNRLKERADSLFSEVEETEAIGTLTDGG